MGGKIKVSSEPGRGSRFEFTVTLGRSSADVCVPPPAPPERLKGLRTLIVDDNHTNRRLLEQITRSWGMLATSVDGGRAALDTLERARQIGTPFDLVLLDAMMPEMDGFMMTEELALCPEPNRAIVIMLSSAAQAGDADRARRLGIAGVLNKPIMQADLLQAVLAILGKLARERTVKIASTQTARPLRILMAEDNPINQQVARNFLVQRGHQVVIAHNGVEAVAAATNGEFDLILMDIQMPEMDGLEATAKIREHQKSHHLPHTPIIALTARAMKEDREQYLAAGMEAFLSKPFTRAEFLQVVEQVAEAALPVG